MFWTCFCINILFALVFALLVGGVTAPYGRYNDQVADKTSGSRMIRALSVCGVHPKIAWALQECPTLVAAAVCWVHGKPVCKSSLGNVALLACFVAHYVNRSVIYPLRMQSSKPVPAPVMLMAMAFCSLNGYIQCSSLSRLLVVPVDALHLPLGTLLWAAGWYINTDADRTLRALRKPGETGYKIPRGGLFEYVSGANFFGEALEWVGFAVAMGGALPGLTFAFCTACNVGPRAFAHHRWYLQKFKEAYPKGRKAFIPLII